MAVNITSHITIYHSSFEPQTYHQWSDNDRGWWISSLWIRVPNYCLFRRVTALMQKKKNCLHFISARKKCYACTKEYYYWHGKNPTFFSIINNLYNVFFWRKMILIFIPEIAFTITGFCSGIYNFRELSMVNIQSLTWRN
jgi:hypothetical protein